jgi:hypothetical protein
MEKPHKDYMGKLLYITTLELDRMIPHTIRLLFLDALSFDKLMGNVGEGLDAFES